MISSVGFDLFFFLSFVLIHFTIKFSVHFWDWKFSGSWFPLMNTHCKLIWNPNTTAKKKYNVQQSLHPITWLFFQYFVWRNLYRCKANTRKSCECTRKAQWVDNIGTISSDVAAFMWLHQTPLFLYSILLITRTHYKVLNLTFQPILSIWI